MGFSFQQSLSPSQLSGALECDASSVLPIFHSVLIIFTMAGLLLKANTFFDFVSLVNHTRAGPFSALDFALGFILLLSSCLFFSKSEDVY